MTYGNAATGMAHFTCAESRLQLPCWNGHSSVRHSCRGGKRQAAIPGASRPISTKMHIL